MSPTLFRVLTNPRALDNASWVSMRAYWRLAAIARGSYGFVGEGR